MTGAVLPCRSYIPSEKCRVISRKDDTKMMRELDSRNLYLFICFPTMRRVLIAWHFLYCAVRLGIAQATSLDVDRIIVNTGSLLCARSVLDPSHHFGQGESIAIVHLLQSGNLRRGFSLKAIVHAHTIIIG